MAKGKSKEPETGALCAENRAADASIGRPPSAIAQSTSAASIGGIHAMSPGRPEHVIEARYVNPSRMFLRFADGVEGTWTLNELDLNMDNMNLATIRASASGTSVEVKSKWGDDVQLDSSSFRVRTDPNYAAEIENALNSLASKIGL